MEKGFLKDLLRSEQTIYSFKELSILWQNAQDTTLKSRVNYYVKQGDLYPIRRGLYAKDKNYNRLELATKILTPAYVSFETVLRSGGITFQYHSQIFVASYKSREIICDGQKYVFKKIKDSILTNPKGLEIGNTYSIATTERALLDTIYLNINYHFDNLSPIKWDKVFDILPIYENNKRMNKTINELYKRAQQSLKEKKYDL